MTIVNNRPLPEFPSNGELKRMMDSDNMQTFTAAVGILRKMHTDEAYALLKKHIDHIDPYKRRCVLGVIFDYPQAVELIPHLERALESDKSFLIGTALGVIITGKVRVSDEAILACLERNLHSVSRYSCYALDSVDKTQRNAQRITNMFHAAKNDSIRTALAEAWYGFCNADNHMTFYELFRNDPVSHIRILACRIVKEYDHPALLQEFTADKDGHIRKLTRA